MKTVAKETSDIILKAISDNWFFRTDNLQVLRVDRQWYVINASEDLNSLMSSSDNISLDDILSKSQFVVDHKEVAISLCDLDDDGEPISGIKVMLDLNGEIVERYVLPSQLYTNTE